MPPEAEWGDRPDPWLTVRMHADQQLRDIEADVMPAVQETMSRYLQAAREAVLNQGVLQSALAAAAGGDPVDLGQWPDGTVWTGIVDEVLLPVLTGHWGEAFRNAARRSGLSAQPYREAYVRQVRDRLSPDSWPAHVFEEVRRVIGEAVEDGAAAEMVAERVASVLNINAWSRQVRERAARLRQVRDNPDSSDKARKRARSELKGLYRQLGPADRQWQGDARRIARTETVGAYNGGTYASNVAWQEESGEQLVKTWLATSDQRVRDTHDHADQQRQPLTEPFNVGGFPLMFPGDPSGPPEEIIQCRCAVATEPADVAASAGTEETVPEPLVEEPELFDIEDVNTPPEPQLPSGWTGVMAPLGTVSGDRRVLAVPPTGEARIRPTPLPLRYQDISAEGHDNSFVVGSIDRVWIVDGKLMGEGRFDLVDDRAAEVARKLADGFARWVSVDLDDVSGTLGLLHSDGTVETVTDPAALSEEGVPEGARMVEIAEDWRVMAATMVATQAFPEATLEPMFTDRDSDTVTADATGSTSLPFAPRDREWDGAAARAAVAKWASSDGSGDKDTIDWAKYAKAFLWRDTTGGGEGGPDFGDYKLPFATVTDGELKAVYRGVSAAAAAIRGARGGVSGIPSSGVDKIRAKLSRLYARARKAFDDDTIRAPWDKREEGNAVAASAGSSTWAEQVATNVPAEPPADWFRDPELTGPTKVRVRSDGRVFGHIAKWGTGHASSPDITPPANPDPAYSRFHRHPVRCADGGRVRTGPLATSGHASVQARVSDAMAHYDNPQFVVADVVAGEDRHGIWVSGALRPGVSPHQVMMADRYSFSGDWRDSELVAACTVSVPGFHLADDPEVVALAASASTDAGGELVCSLGECRVRFRRDRDGEVAALVAAGVIIPQRQQSAQQVMSGVDVSTLAPALARALMVEMRHAEPAPTAAPAPDEDDNTDGGGDDGSGLSGTPIGDEIERVLAARARAAKARLEAAALPVEWETEKVA